MKSLILAAGLFSPAAFANDVCAYLNDAVVRAQNEYYQARVAVESWEYVCENKGNMAACKEELMDRLFEAQDRLNNARASYHKAGCP